LAGINACKRKEEEEEKKTDVWRRRFLFWRSALFGFIQPTTYWLGRTTTTTLKKARHGAASPVPQPCVVGTRRAGWHRQRFERRRIHGVGAFGWCAQVGARLCAGGAHDASHEPTAQYSRPPQLLENNFYKNGEHGQGSPTRGDLATRPVSAFGLP
jgi:hypothetical protein